MLKRLAKNSHKNHFIAYFIGLVFKKRQNFKFFYYAIFGSVIPKLLFLKTGFFVFVILKLLLKNISNSASSFIIDCKNAFSIF
ncbi:hypothetical protein RGC22_03620 [Helicobacter pylori]|uniref:hypothetical protein n=1 Tax=Helicobacter pylori TaxID=210 RepID=UPI002928D0E0|nr:hypothetical protein [Helicobacter pylori]MDU9757068.1 hypothetical protein [Helicobacter pylori]